MTSRSIFAWTAPAALGLLLGLVCISMSASAAGPSFDCAKAASDSEQAICASPRLARLDADLAVAYRARLAREPAILQQQRAWLRGRDAACAKEAGCLRAFMSARLAWMKGTAPMSGRRPRVIGACSLTTLKRKTNRFEGEPDSGSAAEFANGGYQVSYDTVPELERSRNGDPVIYCLAFIPRDCPPHDARGRGNVAANLRTLEAWNLSESEHSCGGA